MSNDQGSQVRAAQLQTQEAANWNQAMSAGMANQLRNVAKPPDWEELAEDALELVITYKSRAQYWRGWAFCGFAYAATQVVMTLWRMFR